MKKNYIIILLITIITLFSFSSIPTFSKYCNQTVDRIIHLFSRYEVTYVTNNGTIYEPDKFSSYVSVKGLTLPTDEDVEKIGYSLGGWFENTDFSGEAIKEIPAGTTGHKTYYANWVISVNPLQVKTSYADGTSQIGLPEGVAIVIGKDSEGNDNVVTLDENGEIIVPKDELVSIRFEYSSEYSISHVDINVKSVVEREYHTGEQYIYYDFKMPGEKVTLTYNDNINSSYIDIAKSSIIFEENVSNGSRTENGFWYKDKIRGMTSWLFDTEKQSYFYIWDNTKPLYVTSNNVETNNQLVLVNGMNVYFKDCKLMARSEYSQNVVDRKLNGVTHEQYSSYAKFDNVTSYANVIFSYDFNQTYTTNFYFQGENYIASMFQNTLKPASDNRMILNINGENNTDILNLGSVWGNYNVKVNNIVLNEYESLTYPDNSEYLFFIVSESSNQGNVSFYNVDLNAPNKRVYSGFGYINYQGNTHAIVGSNRYAYNMGITHNAFLHNLNDITSTYFGLNMTGNASVVLDGEFYTKGYNSGGSSINTNGYLIARGNNFDAQSLTLNNGTIIANSLSIETFMNIYNGTIIVNQIVNAVHKRPTYNADGYISSLTGLNVLELADKNEDNIPFLTYSNTFNSPSTFNINAGNIYLFGEYKVTSTNEYDLSTNLKDDTNPVKKYTDILLTADGELKSGVSLDLNEVENDVKNYTKTVDNECIMLGNSKYKKDGTKGRKFTIGAKAKIYASGNLNFYNDVTISGATIYAGGTLSSKHDLTIASGNIVASKVGNKYNLTTNEDNNIRWKMTNLKGGEIHTNYLGAINDTSKSTVILAGSTVKPINEKIDVKDDLYINYYYDESVFDYTKEIDSISFRAEATGELTTLNKTNETLDNPVTITKPNLKNGNIGRWLYDSLNGSAVDTILENGDIAGTEISVLDKNYISLYAVKESYNLSVAEGIEYIASISESDNILDISPTNLSTDVASTKNITITLNDSSMMDKVIVAYQDGSGIYHTPEIAKDNTNNTVTFKMPYADTIIHITNNIELHLNKYNIELTNIGFNTGIDVTNRELMFEYSGDITITQSTTTATKNRVVFSADSGNMNNPNLNRKIIIKNITQTGTGANYGIEIKDGADVELTISGKNMLYPIKSGGDLTLIGETGKERDSLSIYSAPLKNRQFITVGANSTTIIDNITVNQNKSNSDFVYGRLVYNPDSTKAKEVIYRNSTINYLFYAYASLGYNIDNILFDNCEVNLPQFQDMGENKFYKVNKVTFNKSNVVETNVGGNRKSKFIDMGTTELEFIDSNYSITIKNSTNSVSNYIYTSPASSAKKITLRGNSTFTADHRMIVNNLTLYDNAKVNFTTPDSYLLCPDIEVNDNASINASHIIVSGFYYPNSEAVLTKTGMFNLFDQGKDILDGNNVLKALGYVPRGLVINGGSVTATEFVGGDVYSKITLNGGVLNGNKIGTIGKLYGFTEYNPKVGEEYIYEYEKIPPLSSLITLNDGTINVAAGGYLGGSNSNVNINGGIVNLADNAILGVTDTDKTKMLNYTSSLGLNLENLATIKITNASVEGTNGIINAPYGTLNITGENTQVSVKDMLALKGSVTIMDTKDKYDNPYIVSHGSATHNQVGIIVAENLSALNINISNSAVVYAKNAIVNAPDEADIGLLMVSYNDAKAYLYSDYYGSDGYGHSIIDVKDNVLLNRKYSIHYNLNDDYEDKATNPNPLNFASDESVVLQDAVRYGYDFAGWYDSEGNRVTTITNTNNEDVDIEARWIAKKVKLKVSVSYKDINIDKDEFINEVDLTKGTLDANNEVFTYNGEIEVAYRDLISGPDKIRLDNYNLKSYKAISMKINNNTLNPNDIDLDLNSKTVTKEMLDYYLNSGEAIELAITGVTNI